MNSTGGISIEANESIYVTKGDFRATNNGDAGMFSAAVAVAANSKGSIILTGGYHTYAGYNIIYIARQDTGAGTGNYESGRVYFSCRSGVSCSSDTDTTGTSFTRAWSASYTSPNVNLTINSTFGTGTVTYYMNVMYARRWGDT